MASVEGTRGVPYGDRLLSGAETMNEGPRLPPVRVLYSYPFGLGMSGTGTTALKQVEGLRRAGARVTVMAGYVRRPPAGHGVLRTTQSFMHRSLRIPGRVLGLNRLADLHDRLVARELRRGDYDVVHTWPAAGVRTMLEAQRRGVPSFREVPNTHTAHAYDVMASELERLGMVLPPGHSHRHDPVRLQREEREYQLAFRLLCPSDIVAQSFVERGFQRDRLARHHYGYDPAVFHAREPRRADIFTVVFVGRAEPRKGLHYGLQAWRRSGLEDFGRLVICGAFVPGYRAVVEPELSHPSVEVRGFVHDVAAMMRSAHALLLPSVEEGSALVSYEAMASGAVPLVSTAVGAPCVHDVSGLVHAPRDVEALADHLRHLASNREYFERLSRNATRGAADVTWDRAGARLLDIYSSALG